MYTQQNIIQSQKDRNPAIYKTWMDLEDIMLDKSQSER